MTDDDYDTYNNANRAFLQAFIARSTLTLDEAKPLIAAILSSHCMLSFTWWPNLRL